MTELIISGHHRQAETAVFSPVYLDVNRVEIDWTIRPLLDHLAQFEADFAQAMAVLQPFPCLTLTYEAVILPDPRLGYTKVCRFLDIPVQTGVVRYGRSNPYPLRQLIQNFDEVAHTLQNSPFEWMLFDERM